MKRIISAVLALGCVLILTACGDEESKPQQTTAATTTTPATTTTKSAGEKIGDGITDIGSGIGNIIDGIQGNGDSNKTDGEMWGDAISDIGGGIGSIIDGASEFGDNANEAGNEFINGQQMRSEVYSDKNTYRL